MPIRYFKILLISVLAVVLSPGSVLSQTRQIDSLKRLLTNAGQDTNRFRILYKIAEEYWLGIPDTIDIPNTIKYEDAAFDLAKKLNYKYGMFECLMCYGNVHAYQNKLPESKKYFNEALEVAKAIGDKKQLAEACFEIADDYFTYGNDAERSGLNFPYSLDYHFQALKIFEEIGNRYRMAKTWFAIGRTYAWQFFFNMGHGNAFEIEKCVLNAIKLFKESKETTKEDMANCDFLLGRANYFQGNYAKALGLFLASLKYTKDSSNKTVLANNYLNIGRAYKGLGDSTAAKGNKALAVKLFTEALAYFGLSLNLNTELKSDAYLALCYFYIGDIQINFKQFAQAKINLNKAVFHTGKLNNGGTYQEIYRSLATLDSAEGNYKLALEHYNLYMAYKDSNINMVSVRESLNYKAQYEFDKKEDSLKQKQLITETRLKAEKNQKYLYWTGLGLLAMLSFFVFLNFRNQKKINRLAAEAYASERTELELQSLRAQLNPHFIFNCINSIDAFIHSNDKYNATVYLNKFARLLRNILDSSKLTTVSFAKDIDTLKLYVELEELRHENKFRTEFNIDDELLNNDYKVPALIIQPFVENAILHGLKNREADNGLLQIEIKKTEDKIVYLIKDNGIGRKAAGRIAQNKEASYGMQMSFDRIRLFNKEPEASVKITDLYENEQATGTLIEVQLKIV